MPGNPSLLKPQVYAACATLIAEYPILSAIPLRENRRSAYFLQLPEINLIKTVSFLTRKASRPQHIIQAQFGSGYFYILESANNTRS
ncbi:hypothetical protein VTN00DRAFT_2418 [Thermoascus crustaceus]|uniref:uncharacterized protein n=1 Tax=Thermoascus crustaceus TaxID=5088 RepID=UPI0037431E5A